MTTKQKILDALNLTLDHIGEDRLLDILLDAYKAKDRRISDLERENESEHRTLRLQQESIREEIGRMRRDPTYGAVGDYFFELQGICKGKIRVTVSTLGRVDVFQMGAEGVEYLCTPRKDPRYSPQK